MYGFDGEHRELKKPVGDITEVPKVRAVWDICGNSSTNSSQELHDFLKLALEAREGYESGERDDTVTRKVLALLD